MNEWKTIPSPKIADTFQMRTAHEILVAVRTSENVWTIFRAPIGGQK